MHAVVTKTLAQLIAIVRNRGDLRNTNRFPDSVISPELQAAFGEGYELIADVNEAYFDTSATVITDPGAGSISLPTGTWRVRAIDRLDGTEYVNLPRVGLKDRNRWGATAGKPEAHRLSAAGIELFPPPDTAYTLRVWYTPVAPTLDTTAREYYNGWEEYSIFGALLRLYEQQNRDAKEWQAQVDRQRERLTRAASERNASGPEYLNLFEPDGADWDLPPTWSW